MGGSPGLEVQEGQRDLVVVLVGHFELDDVLLVEPERRKSVFRPGSLFPHPGLPFLPLILEGHEGEVPRDLEHRVRGIPGPPGIRRRRQGGSLGHTGPTRP